MIDVDHFFHYLPVDDHAMQWGVYLTGAGRWTVAPGESYPPTGHPHLYDFKWQRGRTLPEFQLILVTDGSGEFESKTVGLQAFDGSALFLLAPGVWHRYRPIRKVGWTERWISFNGELAHRLRNFQLIPPEGAFARVGSCNDFTARFDSLLDRIHRNPMQSSVLVSFHGLSLVGDAIELVDELPRKGVLPGSMRPSINDPLVKEAIEIIWTRSHSTISVADIARELKITRRTLDRRFAAEIGHSVLHEINTCRMSRAKRLLLHTDLPVKTIAYLAGFSNNEQLRFAFQMSEGKSPREFRATNALRMAGPTQS